MLKASRRIGGPDRCGGLLRHFDDLLDAVSEADLVEHRVPGHDLPEDGVAAVEVRLRGEGDKELAAAGVRAGEGHADRAAAVAQAVDLVADDVARAAAAVAPRVTALDHEVGDDAVEGEAVVETLRRELQEVQAGERRLPRPETCYPMSIVFDPHSDGSIIYLTLGGFGFSHLWKLDMAAGAPRRWQDLGGGRLPDIWASSLVVDPADSGSKH